MALSDFPGDFRSRFVLRTTQDKFTIYDPPRLRRTYRLPRTAVSPGAPGLSLFPARRPRIPRNIGTALKQYMAAASASTHKQAKHVQRAGW